MAPGVDIERDILAQMDFRPLVPSDPLPMDLRCFAEPTMNLRTDLLATPIRERLTLNDDERTLHIDFTGHSVRSRQDIQEIHDAVVERVGPLDHRVTAIVNYDNFSIVPELMDGYVAMVDSLVEDHYSDVTRYSGDAFIRSRLGRVRDGVQDSP